MRFQQNLSLSALCSLGFVYAACLSACDKTHEQSPGVEGAGSGASNAAGSAGSAGAEAGKSAGNTAGMSASGGSSGRGNGSSSAGKGAAGSGGKPAGSGGTAAGSGGGTAAGSGGASGAQAGNAAAGSGGASGAGKRCGTRGGATCGQDEFCNFEPDSECGGTDRGGACEAKPQVCTDIFKPVCGCDNHTYSSDCNAHGAGVSMKHDGLCSPDECEAAGGRAEYSDGASVPECDAGEASWMISGGKEQVICCLPKPAGTAGKTCGGIAALKCDAAQFCNYEESAGGQGCGGAIADAGGKCEETPKACTKESKPVCSCDRRSYDNPCEAHAAGISVMHDGACTEDDCKAIGGRVAFGTGPAPKCNSNETEHGYVVGSGGGIPVEGALCCLP